MNRDQIKRRELLAGLPVFLLGTPFVVAFARAMANGETRRREAPLRAMLGDEDFEKLRGGAKTEEHYLGNELLSPDFVLPDKDGKPWRLRDQRGKTIVMNFWTITCQPCVEEMPSLLELATIAKERKTFEVIAVTTDKNWGEVGTLFPPQHDLKVLFDPDRKVVHEKFGTRLFPETWVIDGRGVVRLRVDGSRKWSDAIAIDAIESVG
jgi:peroxiredoxin